MADKRISQLVDRGTVVNNDVVPIVVFGATTTNKATISSIQTFMQGNLDLGVTSVGITLGSSGTDVSVSGSPITSSGNITINLPDASASARGLVTIGTQTFAGAKTFNSDLVVNGVTVGKGGASNGNNTAIGVNALSSNTTGTLNTATGISALQFNTAGNSNTANGASSLVGNTTGGFNTAIGNQSLYSNTTGQVNTAIGLNSLYSNITGTYNTGIGASAGYYIADGSTPNTTSDFSIYLGADTKASVDNAQNEVVIGYNATGSGSNTVTIGNSSVTDNYFTGTVRSTAVRIAAAGTADPIIFRNTSGTNSSTGNTNVVGFNNVNNIFVTTQSRGGFILGFNNTVSNREYTLQDASGTLAFTSQIPSLAGYVTLDTAQTITAQKTIQTNSGSDTFIVNHTSGNGIGVNITKGGNNEALRVAKTSGSGNAVTITGGLLSAEAVTLTGALNGTSALFSGLVTFSNSIVSTAGVMSLQKNGSGTVGSGPYYTLYNNATTDGMLFQLNASNNIDFWGLTSNSFTASPVITLTRAGAATFSSSVTAGGLITGQAGIYQTNAAMSMASNRYETFNGGATQMFFGFPASGSVEFNNGSPKLHITSTGSVGIGTSTPSTARFEVVGAIPSLFTADSQANSPTYGGSIFYRNHTGANQGNGITFALNNASNVNSEYGYIGGLIETNTAGSQNGAIIFAPSSAGARTERMRITSGGVFKAKGSESTYHNINATYHELRTGAGGNWTTVISNTAGNPFGLDIDYNSVPNNIGNEFLHCTDGIQSTLRASIRSNGGIANYATNNVVLSDERLKKDIEPLESYWDKFKAIEIVKYKYIDQTHDDFNIGVIAQQVEAIAPEFVDIDGWDTKPKLDEDGNEIVREEEPLKSVYASDLHHATIKVLQEAMQKIENLQEQIDSLKNQMQ